MTKSSTTTIILFPKATIAKGIQIVSAAMNGDQGHSEKLAVLFNGACKTKNDIGALRHQLTSEMNPEGKAKFRALFAYAVKAHGLKLHGWVSAKANTSKADPMAKVTVTSERTKITKLLDQYQSLSDEGKRAFRAMLGK